MIEHAYTVVCRESYIDRDSNQSAIVVLEEFTLGGEPPADTPLLAPEVYTLWCRDLDHPEGEELSARVKLLSPLGATLAEKEFSISFATGLLRIRARIRLGSIPFKGAGNYKYQVERKDAEESWQFVASVPVRVVVQSGAPE